MTANMPSARRKQGLARLWRVILDWDQANDTDPFVTMLDSLERRVSKLEQKVSHSKN